MREPAFTPGPWIIFRERARDGLLTIGVSGPFGPKKHIAEMCWAKDVADKETGATGHADARLIAAAPALYEALDTALRILVENGLANGAIGDDCLAALSLALGESPNA